VRDQDRWEDNCNHGLSGAAPFGGQLLSELAQLPKKRIPLSQVRDLAESI
jgi:hypothetical protein